MVDFFLENISTMELRIPVIFLCYFRKIEIIGNINFFIKRVKNYFLNITAFKLQQLFQ